MDVVELLNNAKNLAQEANIKNQDRGAVISSLVVAQLLLDDNERLELEALNRENPVEELRETVDEFDEKTQEIFSTLDDLGDDINTVLQRMDTLEERVETLEQEDEDKNDTTDEDDEMGLDDSDDSDDSESPGTSDFQEL